MTILVPSHWRPTRDPCTGQGIGVLQQPEAAPTTVAYLHSVAGTDCGLVFRQVYMSVPTASISTGRRAEFSADVFDAFGT